MLCYFYFDVLIFNEKILKIHSSQGSFRIEMFFQQTLVQQDERIKFSSHFKAKLLDSMLIASMLIDIMSLFDVIALRLI